MSRSPVIDRLCVAIVVLVASLGLPTHAQTTITMPYVPMSQTPHFSDPVYRCCIEEAIEPPSLHGCFKPCDNGVASCSGNLSHGSYTTAQCVVITDGPGTCYRSSHQIYVPDWMCMASECQIQGEPGEQCRWIVAFGSGINGFGLRCGQGSTPCQ